MGDGHFRVWAGQMPPSSSTVLQPCAIASMTARPSPPVQVAARTSGQHGRTAARAGRAATVRVAGDVGPQRRAGAGSSSPPSAAACEVSRACRLVRRGAWSRRRSA